MLYVVATPIGNLADLSFRAVDLLRNVDLIVAEDTRRSRILLANYQIKVKLLSLHAHNEAKLAEGLLDKLNQGIRIALISDAGTPLISDPGSRLINMAHAANIPVCPVPGASAVTAALSISGLVKQQFIFIGFLPARSQEKLKLLKTLSLEERALVIFEAPHRLLATLQLMVEIFGKTREITFCRELTKKFETIKQARLATIYDFVAKDLTQQTKGEIVLVVAGKTVAPDLNGNAAAGVTACMLDPKTVKILEVLLVELPLATASKLAAKITGVPRKILYEYGKNSSPVNEYK